MNDICQFKESKWNFLVISIFLIYLLFIYFYLLEANYFTIL